MLPLTPEPIADVTWFDTERVPLAVAIYEQVTMDDLRDLFDTTFTAVGGAISRGELTPAGPALCLYRGDPRGTFDIEIGFPVRTPWSGPIDADGVTVVASEWPPGPTAALSHVGGYDALGDSWGRLMAVAASSASGEPVALGEVYVTEPPPQADPATLRTDLLVAVERTKGR
ncbi:hypothetical protein BHE97_11145 [Aeromicrobium sp. PE09-221]|uniref:GyrI-like domain-containing protein n=1 Tax=Aeromicrobium sp. PE09-221 TaxID=1898043 RepID=UPI000B3E5321|nr:GyrI-like domain-containing protein [Aeromicrobium sp. PE09-221]OUZ09270.1 hypothetical protein BHE97_11145 [Aeromicrobium sp. PE09-221]